MFDWFKKIFKEKPKSRLGIDLGSSIIKIVEIAPGADKLKLKTYGLASFSTEGFLSHAFSSFVNTGDAGRVAVNFGEKGGSEQTEFLAPSKSTIKDLANREIGGIIKELVVKSGVETNIAYFAVPSFATFSTIITLPAMPAQEIAAAIPYEARKYIPVPLDDVVLDWILIGEDLANEPALDSGNNNSKIIQASGANQVAAGGGQQEKVEESGDSQIEITKKEISDKKEIEEEIQKDAEKDTEKRPLSAEQQTEAVQESFEQAEPIKKQNNSSAAGQGRVKIFLVAILKEIIEKYTQIARVAGLEIRVLESESFCLARALTQGMDGLILILDIGDYFLDITLIDNGFIKVIHNAEGIIDHNSKTIDEARLVSEIKKVLKLYATKAGRISGFSVDDLNFKGRIIITGGKAANYKFDYLKKYFQTEIVFGNPFLQLDYPPVLQPILEELGPSLAVAVGMAMRS